MAQLVEHVEEQRWSLTRFRGNPSSQYVAEFWNPHTLEFELRSMTRFTARAEARAAVPAFIESCNHRRRHSALGMLSPVDYELSMHGTDAA